MVKKTENRSTASETEIERQSQRLDSIGWGVGLLWIGFAFLLEIGWGLGLLGIATIILGEAALRRNAGLKVEGFWIVVGIMFLAAAMWELLDIALPLAPLLIIFCGAAVLWGVYHDRHLMKK